jgi:hypothetical protein
LSESEKERVGVNLFVEIEEELGCGSLAIGIEFRVFFICRCVEMASKRSGGKI